MLSRFMTRPDVKKEKLPEYLDWSLSYIHKADSRSLILFFAEKEVFKFLHILRHELEIELRLLTLSVSEESMTGMIAMSGVLTTLGLLFKHGKREDLVHCGTILQKNRTFLISR